MPATGWYRQSRARGWLSPSSGRGTGRRRPGPGPASGRDVGGRTGLRPAGWSPPRPYRRPVPARPWPAGRVTSAVWSPATTYDVLLSGPAGPGRRWPPVTTLPPPPGRLLGRFATISDCHVGERCVGPLGRFHDPDPRPAGSSPCTPMRCARAAIAEAEAGAPSCSSPRATHLRTATAEEFDEAAEVLVRRLRAGRGHPGQSRRPRSGRRRGSPGRLRSAPRPRPAGPGPPRRPAGARSQSGPRPPRRGRHADRRRRPGRAGRRGAAARSWSPCTTRPRRWPVQTHYPPSILWRDSTRLLDGLAAANPATLIVAGHTHRNRRYPVRGLTVAEVGSTKDYPGQWAGYSVYEGGIRQVGVPGGGARGDRLDRDHPAGPGRACGAGGAPGACPIGAGPWSGRPDRARLMAAAISHPPPALEPRLRPAACDPRVSGRTGLTRGPVQGLDPGLDLGQPCRRQRRAAARPPRRGRRRPRCRGRRRPGARSPPPARLISSSKVRVSSPRPVLRPGGRRRSTAGADCRPAAATAATGDRVPDPATTRRWRTTAPSGPVTTA